MTMRRTTTIKRTLTIASVRSIFHLYSLIALLVVCFMPQVSLYAQTDTLGLPSAVVTERAKSGDMMPVQVLSGQALQSMRSHSVADALRYFSGVQLKDYGGLGGMKTVNVRGLGTQHVGVVLDGVPLLNSQNATIDLGRFSLEEMECLTLYNGQRTTLLQPAACFSTSSAVFMESRRPDFGPMKLRAAIRAGSFGTFQPSLSIDKTLSSSLAATLSAGYVHSDGGYSFRYRVAGAYDTTGMRHNSDIDAFRIETGLYGQGEKDKWHIRAYLYASERGLPGAVVRGKKGSGERQWDTNLFLQSTWRRKQSDTYTMLNTAKVSYDRMRYLNDPLRDEAAMYADNIYRTASLYLSSAHSLAFRKVSLALAADYRMERMLANLYQFPSPTRHTAFVSAAAQTAWHGLRIQGDVLGTFVFDHTHSGNAMQHKTSISPALSLFWKPSEHAPFSLRAFAKHVFRMPTLNDLYYTLVGNSNLKPERAWQFDVGVTWNLRPYGMFLGGELKADVYHNMVSDKIVAIPSSSMFRWTMLNLGRVSLQGAEVGAQGAVAISKVRLDLRLTYTYERARDVTDRTDPFYGDQIPYIPRHSGSVIAVLAWNGLSVRYSFLYTGQRYDQRANTPENFAPAWYTSDLAASYTLKRWELSAEVNNLLHQRYEIVKGYPLPGRNVMFGLAYQW